jgi:fructokinase
MVPSGAAPEGSNLIVVCGEALVDVIHNADGTQRSAPGGGPFNTARALARLGVHTAFLGRLSTDRFGRELETLLREDGVDLGLAGFGPEPTTIAIADIDRGGIARYRFEVDGTSAPNLTPESVPEDLGPDVRALHVGSLGLALEPMASTIAGLVARQRGKRFVMVDPNIRPGLGPEDEYRARLRAVTSAATVVKASDADLSWLYPGVEMVKAARSMLDEGPVAVVVTLGAAGALALHRDVLARVPAPQVDVVDTIGAGDSFGAALLAWLAVRERLRPRFTLEERELRSALEFACLVAALTCTRAGAESPTRDELEISS